MCNTRYIYTLYMATIDNHTPPHAPPFPSPPIPSLPSFLIFISYVENVQKLYIFWLLKRDSIVSLVHNNFFARWVRQRVASFYTESIGIFGNFLRQLKISLQIKWICRMKIDLVASLVHYDWPKWTKFLLAVTHRSPRQHSNSS